MNTPSTGSIKLHLRIIREPAFSSMTPRKRAVCWDFGVPPRESPFAVVDGVSLELSPGSILLLSGPSGSGKSSVLSAIADQINNPCWVGTGRVRSNRPIVDLVAPGSDLRRALEILTACGLGEPRLWIRQYADLSDGERFRAALARAVGMALSRPTPSPIFCDEFTAILHRRAACAIAYNLRKLVSRYGLTLVVATTHEDILDDLRPDHVLRLGGTQPMVETPKPTPATLSLRRRTVIEPGSVRDYASFAPMHYRHRDGLGFVDKVFLLREGAGGAPLGILVFAHAPLELTLRNQATNGRFRKNVRRLNRDLRILRRLVMHPDVRGCGLGHWFVARTLPRVGVRFVECLAAMGSVNPVFEKAGMTRIGRCLLPRGRLALLTRLREWKLDPFAEDFEQKVSRYPRLRALVHRTIEDWIRVAHGARGCDLTRKPGAVLARTFRQLLGEPPMYYLWDREGVFPARSAREERHDPRGASAERPDRTERDRHRPE
jgi:ABC-type lipoprotein export system ATPase subunit